MKISFLVREREFYVSYRDRDLMWFFKRFNENKTLTVNTINLYDQKQEKIYYLIKIYLKIFKLNG